MTIRLATWRAIPAIMMSESRHYIGNLEPAERSDGFNAVTLDAYRKRYDVGVLFVAADIPRSLHAVTTKLAATPLATFDVDATRHHFLAFRF